MSRGAGDEAEAGFKMAIGLFRELSMPFWMAVSLLEQAELLTSSGRIEEARAPANEARGIFEALKTRPWLERTEALLPAVARVGT